MNLEGITSTSSANPGLRNKPMHTTRQPNLDYVTYLGILLL